VVEDVLEVVEVRAHLRAGAWERAGRE